MADFPQDVADSIKHIEGLIKQLLDVSSQGMAQTRGASGLTTTSKQYTPEEIEKLEQKRLRVHKEIIANLERIDELENQIKNKQVSGNEKIELSNELEEKRIIVQQRRIEMLKTVSQLEEENYQRKLKDGSLTNEDILLHQKKQGIYKEQVNHVNQQLRGFDALRKSTGDLLAKLTGLSMTWQEMASVRFAKDFRDAFQGGGLSSALKSVGKGMVDVFGPTNLLGNAWSMLLTTWGQAITQADQLRADFNKATGTTGEYTTQILELRKEYSEYVLNIEDSFKAYETLMTKLSGFRDLNRDVQQEIAGHSAMMDKLGVSYDATSQFMETANLALGMTHTESMRVQGQFVKLADGMKMTANELIQGFNEASKSLAAYGKDAPRIFANVAKFADKAGIAVSSLLKMTQQFDQFENAAGQVGKLNAMLGGSYLSTIDMLNASEDERIMKIKESIDLAGVQFDQMGKYQKLYITQTLGLQSVDEASKLLGGSMADLNARLSEQNLTQEEAAERAQKFSTISAKLEAIFQNIIFALEPIIDLLHGFLDVVTDIIGVMNEYPVLWGVLIAAWVAWNLVIKSTIMSMLGMGTAATTSTPAIVASGTAAKGASMGMLAMAAAAIGIGVGIGIAVAAVALLVYAFTNLLEVMGNLPLGDIALNAIKLSGSLLALTGAVPLATLALLGLAAGFMALGIGMLLVDEDDINAMAQMFDHLSDVLTDFDTAIFDKIVEGIEKVAEAIDDVDEDNMFRFGYVFEQIGNAMTVAAGTGVETLSQMVGTMETATAQERRSGLAAAASRTDRITTTIKESNSSVVNNNRSAGGPIVKQPIVVELNKREVGKFVLEVFDNAGSQSRT